MTAYRRSRGVNTHLARIFNTYGPRLHPSDGRVISNFLMQALRGEPLTIYGDGSQTRSFCYVADLIEGIVLLSRSGEHTPVNRAIRTKSPFLRAAQAILDTHRFQKQAVLYFAARGRPHPPLPRHHQGPHAAGTGNRGFH